MLFYALTLTTCTLFQKEYIFLQICTFAPFTILMRIRWWLLYGGFCCVSGPVYTCCLLCGNTSILVIGKKSYTFKYTKKPPANCKNSNILKMSLGPTSGIWNFHDFFMFFNILTELFNGTCLLEILHGNSIIRASIIRANSLKHLG